MNSDNSSQISGSTPNRVRGSYNETPTLKLILYTSTKETRDIRIRSYLKEDIYRTLRGICIIHLSLDSKSRKVHIDIKRGLGRTIPYQIKNLS